MVWWCGGVVVMMCRGVDGVNNNATLQPYYFIQYVGVIVVTTNPPQYMYVALL